MVAASESASKGVKATILQSDGTDRVKSNRKLTKPVGMSLASQERSTKRELFEQAKREKEEELRVQQELFAQEKQLQEEEEIRKLRQEINFKATPIRRYRFKVGQTEEKKLTVPISPKLTTQDRADFKKGTEQYDDEENN